MRHVNLLFVSTMTEVSPFIQSVEYGLSLADGSQWRISGRDAGVRIVEKLAAIMTLDKSKEKNIPNIIFSTCNDKSEITHSTNIIAQKKYCFSDIGLCLWQNPDHQDVLWEIAENSRFEMQFIIMQHTLFPIYQQSMMLGGLPLHAALSEFHGNGVLLVGSSNSGKSTTSNRLPPYWHSLCDDESLVVCDGKSAYLSHPFPTWSDYILGRDEKIWPVEKAIPIHGIFFLKQDTCDKVEGVGKGEAAVLVNQSAMEVCSRFRQPMSMDEKRCLVQQTFKNACNLAQQIPAYRLHFSQNGRFWEGIEAVLENESKS